MYSTTTPEGKKVWLRTWAMAMVPLLAVIAAAAPVPHTQKKGMIPLDDLRSEQARTRDRAVDSILRDRRAVIEQLIPLIDPANVKKYSKETRIAAAYALGELRAVEAVPVLSKTLAEPLGWEDNIHADRYLCPVFEALVKIGQPAVPAMIENIETTNDPVLRRWSLGVMCHTLGGKRRLLDLLDKLGKRALDKQPPDRAMARRVKDAHDWAEKHYKYKPGEEPLY